MLVQKNQFLIETKEKMRGGEGVVTIKHLAPNETLRSNSRMMAEITIPPGASIGYHQHEKETEYFLFVSGSGTLNDNGKDVPVKSGDVAITGNGSSHSLTNTGKRDLVVHAIILM
ncbi:oxalate-binding protein [Spirochaetia bacterium]|nr:oxalate-binding protein [Spirochaetia bacterium]